METRVERRVEAFTRPRPTRAAIRSEEVSLVTSVPLMLLVVIGAIALMAFFARPVAASERADRTILEQSSAAGPEAVGAVDDRDSASRSEPRREAPTLPDRATGSLVLRLAPEIRDAVPDERVDRGHVFSISWRPAAIESGSDAAAVNEDVPASVEQAEGLSSLDPRSAKDGPSRAMERDVLPYRPEAVCGPTRSSRVSWLDQRLGIDHTRLLACAEH